MSAAAHAGRQSTPLTHVAERDCLQEDKRRGEAGASAFSFSEEVE